MTLRRFPVAVAAAALAVSSVAVQAAPAARSAAPTVEENDLGRGSFLWIAIVIGVIIGVVLLLDDDDNPVSP